MNEELLRTTGAEKLPATLKKPIKVNSGAITTNCYDVIFRNDEEI